MGLVELANDIDLIRERIEGAIAAGTAVLTLPSQDHVQAASLRAAYLRCEKRTEALLEASFRVSGFMSSNPKAEFSSTSISLLDLKISMTTLPLERVQEVRNDVDEKLRVLESIQDRLDIYEDQTPKAAPARELGAGPIFLVHGHDLARREVVRRFVERITGQRVIVLDEQPNRGQDVLGKLLAHATQAGFAVILLTPDDLGGNNADVLQPRARQNVVFEMGMFMGLLGRNGVAVMHEQSIELPSDYQGVVYIPIAGEDWQIKLARELKEAGYTVDLSGAL